MILIIIIINIVVIYLFYLYSCISFGLVKNLLFNYENFQKKYKNPHMSKIKRAFFMGASMLVGKRGAFVTFS